MQKLSITQFLWVTKSLGLTLKKIPLVMKLFFVFLINSISLLHASGSYAQTARISLDTKNQTVQEVLEQIEAKMAVGFRCIKLKIGAINFEEELALLRFIRSHFSAKEVELRVDANGAFAPADAMEKLKRLAELDLHSIEQPIRAGQWEDMARLTAETPLPIALDEELIGINIPERKQCLLDSVHPQYIILKPSLHGGMAGGNEWIREAEKRNIGWWITSALESNIGLNAIAHWCATFNNPLPQGLGTGALFTNNVDMPLEVRKDSLWYLK